MSTGAGTRPDARVDPEIGPTAHYTAYVWQRLGLPHAQWFATRRGAVLYWSFFAAGEWTTRILPGLPSMKEYLEYRHRLIDAEVEALQPDCVVELGAGLTPRTAMFAVDRGAAAIDIDLAPMIAVRRAALARAPASVRAALDHRWKLEAQSVLAPDFGARLRAWLAPHRRPVVIAEGLLGYLDGTQRHEVICAVGHALAGTQGAFVCDLHTVAAQAEVGRAATILRLAIAAVTGRRRSLDPYPSREAVVQAFTQSDLPDVAFIEATDHVQRDSRLAHLSSPAHVVRARP